VVQLYVRDEQALLQRPEKELKAFAKMHLERGKRQTVTLSVVRDALAYYDDQAHEWVAEVGASSQDIPATATCGLTASSTIVEQVSSR
jgi:beta-glucosidase